MESVLAIQINKAMTRNDWKIVPMPREQGLLYANLNYTTKEFEKLREGFYPHNEDDHWFVYCQNQNLHFHLKEGGYCIFILEFIEDRADGYSAYYAKVNRNRNQYKFISERLDLCLLVSIIDFLLGRNDTITECPMTF